MSREIMKIQYRLDKKDVHNEGAEKFYKRQALTELGHAWALRNAKVETSYVYDGADSYVYHLSEPDLLRHPETNVPIHFKYKNVELSLEGPK